MGDCIFSTYFVIAGSGSVFIDANHAHVMLLFPLFRQIGRKKVNGKLLP